MKEGLDYFPRPVDFLHTKEMRKLMRACGPSAVAVIDEVDGLIYGRRGYYLEWDEDTCFDVADTVRVKEGFVSEVVKKALEIGLYDTGNFAGHTVLTNQTVQDNYHYATKNRKGNRTNLYPINVVHNPVNEHINSINEPDNPHSIEKYRKEKDSKQIDQAGAHELNAFASWEKVWGFPNGIAQQDLMSWTDEFGDDLVVWVIEYAARRAIQAKGADKYVDRVLDHYRQTGITTVEQAEAESEQHANTAKANAPRPANRGYGRLARQEDTPDWMQPGYKPESKPVTPEVKADIQAGLAELKAMREAKANASTD